MDFYLGNKKISGTVLGYLGEDPIAKSYLGFKQASPNTPTPGIVKSNLDYYYDFTWGSYTPSGEWVDLSQPNWYGNNPYEARNLTLSGSGTNPTFVSDNDGYTYPTQSNSSPVTKTYYWDTGDINQGLRLSSVPGFTFQFIIKTGNLPLFVDGGGGLPANYCKLFSAGLSPLIGPKQESYSIKFTDNSPSGIAARIFYESNGYTSAAIVNNFINNQWKLISIDYTNATGVVNWYVNNVFQDSDTIAIGISAFDSYFEIGNTWTGDIAVAILYQKILNSAERLQNYQYYQTRYTFG